MADTPVSMTLSAEVAEAVRLRDAATPGPWKCVTKYTRPEYATGAVYGPDCVVAEVGGYTDKELLLYNKQRWDADKKLIAAAPSHVDLIERLFNALKATQDAYVETSAALTLEQDRNEGLHARVRELMADAVFAASTKKHHGVLMEENERLRAELLRARAKLRDCIPIAGTKTARMKP